MEITPHRPESKVRLYAGIAATAFGERGEVGLLFAVYMLSYNEMRIIFGNKELSEKQM